MVITFSNVWHLPWFCIEMDGQNFIWMQPDNGFFFFFLSRNDLYFAWNRVTRIHQDPIWFNCIGWLSFLFGWIRIKILHRFWYPSFTGIRLGHGIHNICLLESGPVLIKCSYLTRCKIIIRITYLQQKGKKKICGFNKLGSNSKKDLVLWTAAEMSQMSHFIS